ncbi:MAG: PSD1 and planctomycete cytochrome C domain-containing protein [Limisphaerales bacterium]
MPSLRLLLVIASSVALLTASLAAPAASAKKVDYNRDIRPVLSENCFFCHGPDEKKREAKLRLDVREAAIAAKAFVPGKPDQSELVKRIFTKDVDDLMPPPDSHKKLTVAQKDLFKRWIAEGAEYQTHWAYVAPKRPAVPAGKNGVDVLVQQRLKEVGLKPSAEADRRTLARRLYFDLLGLPPKPEEVDAFANDKSPDAYAKLVERLLASPHYGERMAIGWLDVVRYADTIGYHSDTPRNVFPYRDYVIKSFNENKRFDQFTREQLAGDLFPNASLETRVASAFNRLILSTEEGGAQPKDYEQRYLTDRVRAVGTVWLAQTTGCAQCHDHKFDPIAQRDFYSLGAFFADIKEPIVGKREEGMPVPSAQDTAEVVRLDGEITKFQSDFDAPHPELSAKFNEWQDTAFAAVQQDAKWKPLKPAKVASAQKSKLAVQADGSVLASGKAPDKDTYTVTVTNALKAVTGLRVEALPDDSLPAKGPGRGANGNFVLTEVAVKIQAGKSKPEPVKLAAAHATIEQAAAAPQKSWAAAHTIDGDEKDATLGWAVLPEVGQAQHLVLELTAPLSVEAGDTLTIELRQNSTKKEHLLGKFRLATTSEADAARVAHPAPPPADIAVILKVTTDKRTGAQKDKLFAHFKGLAPELAKLRTDLAAAKKAKTDFEAKIPKCLVSVSSETKRTVRILPRGNWMDESGPVMQPALPAFLPVSLKRDAKADAPLTRADLAEWIVAKDNPLTARVFVNRLWKQFFGTGLSKVLDDMGAQGEPPVNPALLDWLASEFVASGWDVKHLVRTIVMSATYRQTSVATKEQQARDPFNREHARQSRWRVDAELVRDNALTIAGLLNPKIGGPSVKPYQPDGYWENLNFPVRSWEASKGDEQFRRGLYTWWQRSFLHPSMLAFDAPSREECAAERTRSNIPQQALVLLNDPTYVESARAFAARIVKEGSGDAAARINWAWKQALSRAPRPDELATARALYDKHLAQYKADPKAAESLLKVGLAPLPSAADQAELAAWTSVARVILNLHETITRS